MRKTFETAELEIVNLSVDDIVTISLGDGDHDNETV